MKRIFFLLFFLVLCQLADAADFYSQKFIKIASGSNHNLAIDSQGNLWTWGYNLNGQLGDGTNLNRTAPVQILDGKKFISVAAGESHSLAIDSDGNLWAFGDNKNGQLGDGTTVNQYFPVRVKTENKFITVAAKGSHSLAIDIKHKLWAFGDNEFGQLGDSTIIDRNIPVAIKTDTRFVSVSAGWAHSHAIDEKGNLWAFGNNRYGQLGDFNEEKSIVPVHVKINNKFSSVKDGAWFSLAIDSSNYLWALGDKRDGLEMKRYSPIQISNSITFQKISAGIIGGLAFDNQNSIWTFSSASNSDVIDSTSNIYSIQELLKNNSCLQVESGLNHSLIIDRDSFLWVCGNNDCGQLGNGTTQQIFNPVKLNLKSVSSKNTNKKLFKGECLIFNKPDEFYFQSILASIKEVIDKKEWEKAIEVFNYYRPQFPNMESRFEKTINLLKLNDEKLTIKNLGSSINSESPEYLPVITADGKRMYFTGYDRKGKIGSEDIFVSEMIDGKWSNAEIIGNLNTKSNESVDGISADGNRLVFFGNFANSFGKGDIFYSDNMLGGWCMIKHFPKPINSNYFDGDAFLTSDGKAILFVSDRNGGVGGFHAKDQLYNGNYWGNTDIYVCTKTTDGWSSPINIGEIVNTPGAERTPFLHSDGKTLYFSSDSHYGLGGIDVYKTVRLNDSLWTEWSEPVNLGKEINTAGDDWGYRISTDGKLAYFAADNRAGGFGDDDIYSITLPKIAKPEPVVTISGKVTNEKGIPLEAAIKWDNLTSQKNIGELKSNPENGKYFIVLPIGKQYGYFAEKEGYYSVSKNIDITLDSTSQNLTEDIILYSIEEIKITSKPVVINNIFFNFDKFELRPESFPELDRLAEILKGYPDKMVEISGHTDNKGTAEYNNTLSFNRANSVVEYLISKGCIREKLVAKGYGFSIPLADNSSEEGQAQNRRVEFKFLMN